MVQVRFMKPSASSSDSVLSNCLRLWNQGPSRPQSAISTIKRLRTCFGRCFARFNKRTEFILKQHEGIGWKNCGIGHRSIAWSSCRPSNFNIRYRALCRAAIVWPLKAKIASRDLARGLAQTYSHSKSFSTRLMGSVSIRYVRTRRNLLGGHCA